MFTLCRVRGHSSPTTPPPNPSSPIHYQPLGKVGLTNFNFGENICDQVKHLERCEKRLAKTCKICKQLKNWQAAKKLVSSKEEKYRYKFFRPIHYDPYGKSRVDQYQV